MNRNKEGRIMAETATSSGFSMEFRAVPWWLILLEGIAAIIIGIAFWMAPYKTVFFVVQVLGWYWLIVGIINIISIFMDKSNWGWKLLSGIIGIIAGALIIRYPFASGVVIPATIVFLIGIMGLVLGCISLLQGFKGGGWGVAIIGVLTIILGLLIIVNPYVSAILLLYLASFLAVAGGAVAIYLAFTMRK
jgi:uncharacterized membrane protein HdeD (DUF308 family)